MDENKCKVYLLSGFLGSGKTTLLKHLLETHPENERVAVLMNEFGKAERPRDNRNKPRLDLLRLREGRLPARTLHDTQGLQADGAARRGERRRGHDGHEEGPRPRDAARLLPLLHDYYRFAGNICVIDAEHFEDWLDLFNAVIKQTEAATQLIINKTDLVTQEQADALEKHLHELNPTAQITRASFGNVPWSLFRSDEADEKMAEIPEAEAWEKFIDDVLANATPHMAPPDNLASLSVFWKGDPEKFKEILDKLPDDVVRSKGYFVDTDGKWKVFDIVGSKNPVYTDASPEFSQPRNLAIFIRKVRARREIPGLFQDAGLKLLELRF